MLIWLLFGLLVWFNVYSLPIWFVFSVSRSTSLSWINRDYGIHTTRRYYLSGIKSISKLLGICIYYSRQSRIHNSQDSKKTTHYLFYQFMHARLWPNNPCLNKYCDWCGDYQRQRPAKQTTRLPLNLNEKKHGNNDESKLRQR